jgi:hypothetical protein
MPEYSARKERAFHRTHVRPTTSVDASIHRTFNMGGVTVGMHSLKPHAPVCTVVVFKAFLFAGK